MAAHVLARRRAGRRARSAGPTRCTLGLRARLPGRALRHRPARRRWLWPRASGAGAPRRAGARARSAGRSSGSRRGRTHERRRPSTSANVEQPQDADDEEMPRVVITRERALVFGVFVVSVDRLPVLRAAADLAGLGRRLAPPRARATRGGWSSRSCFECLSFGGYVVLFRTVFVRGGDADRLARELPDHDGRRWPPRACSRPPARAASRSPRGRCGARG